MERKFVCYCGLYCENCAVKAKVEPAAQVLYNEMKEAGFEGIMPFMPDGDSFWRFLKSTAQNGTCVSCQEGSGNPNCTIRMCAKEKGIEACALCESYPCEHFARTFEVYGILKEDNELLREKGFDEWGTLQDERKSQGFTYTG